MNNTTIKESFTLPSHGKLYDREVNEHFTLRSMSVNDEMLRLSPSEHEYDTLCDLIDRCMVESPGISAYDMCLGDYQYCLYMLRVVTYGSTYKMMPKCSYCLNYSNKKFNLYDLKLLEWDDDLYKHLEFDLPVCGRRVTINPQTPRMLDNILDRVNRYKKKIETNLDSTILCEIMGLIKYVDGAEMNEFQLENWVRNLNMQDVSMILGHSKKLNESIGFDNKIILTCDYCKLTYATRLAITSEFFRPSLDI